MAIQKLEKIVLLLSVLLALASILAYIGYFFPSIQTNVFVMGASWVLFILCYALSYLVKPSAQFIELYQIFVDLDFYVLIVDGILGYLLFAGCLHVDIASFFKNLKVIVALSVVTTLLAFFLTAFLIHGSMWLIGLKHSMLTCFLYAAVIAPTDPVAVLSLLKNLNLSKTLYTKVASESLLNDGIGVVLFTTVVNCLDVTQIDGSVLLSVSEFFIYDGLVSLVVGVLIAYMLLSYAGVKHAGTQNIFLLLAVLNTGYVCAKLLHLSVPLVSVGAGLYSSHVVQSLSTQSKHLIYVFWDTIDEIFNYCLFFVVGFQVIFVDPSATFFLMMLMAVVVNFIVRMLSVSAPLSAIRIGYAQNTTLYRTLVVGGLKGGLSLALALSIPRSYPGFDVIFDMTYAVVVFTVIVQGASIDRYLSVVKAKKTDCHLVL